MLIQFKIMEQDWLDMEDEDLEDWARIYLDSGEYIANSSFELILFEQDLEQIPEDIRDIAIIKEFKND